MVLSHLWDRYKMIIVLLRNKDYTSIEEMLQDISKHYNNTFGRIGLGETQLEQQLMDMAMDNLLSISRAADDSINLITIRVYSGQEKSAG